MKKLIIITTLVTSIIILLLFTGYFFSGFTLFSGKYQVDILSAFGTVIGSILAPAISLIAALLFYDSLKEQRKSISLQQKTIEADSMRNKSDGFIREYFALLDSIDRFGKNYTVTVKNHYSGSCDITLSGASLIDELYIKWQLLDNGLGQIWITENNPEVIKLFSAPIGSYVEFNEKIAVVVERSYIEISELINAERVLYLLFNTVLNVLSTLENRETYVNILATHLNRRYLEVVLNVFNRYGQHPNELIVFEMMNKVVAV